VFEEYVRKGRGGKEGERMMRRGRRSMVQEEERGAQLNQLAFFLV
jgi:hypothetical protein